MSDVFLYMHRSIKDRMQEPYLVVHIDVCCITVMILENQVQCKGAKCHYIRWGNSLNGHHKFKIVNYREESPHILYSSIYKLV